MAASLRPRVPDSRLPRTLADGGGDPGPAPRPLSTASAGAPGHLPDGGVARPPGSPRVGDWLKPRSPDLADGGGPARGSCPVVPRGCRGRPLPVGSSATVQTGQLVPHRSDALMAAFCGQDPQCCEVLAIASSVLEGDSHGRDDEAHMAEDSRSHDAFVYLLKSGRANGEWFLLSQSDVAASRRRRFM